VPFLCRGIFQRAADRITTLARHRRRVGDEQRLNILWIGNLQAVELVDYVWGIQQHELQVVIKNRRVVDSIPTTNYSGFVSAIREARPWCPVIVIRNPTSWDVRIGR